MRCYGIRRLRPVPLGTERCEFRGSERLGLLLALVVRRGGGARSPRIGRSRPGAALPNAPV